MTTKEHLSQIEKIVSDLKTENQKLIENTANQVASINEKIDKKHEPIYLEQDILRTSHNDGLFDKVCNELKQDSVFKAKMSLAVAKVVEECLQEKKQ